jgi:hypothetical protein
LKAGWWTGNRKPFGRAFAHIASLARLKFSVKVVRHKKWIFCCGWLWRTNGYGQIPVPRSGFLDSRPGTHASRKNCLRKRLVRRNRGWIPALAACRVSDRVQVRGLGKCERCCRRRNRLSTCTGRPLGLCGQRLPELNLIPIQVIDPRKATVGFVHSFGVNLYSLLF